jgi:hypothetical protein
MEVVLVYKVNHIPNHDWFKTGFFLQIAAFRITALLTPMNRPARNPRRERGVRIRWELFVRLRNRDQHICIARQNPLAVLLSQDRKRMPCTRH